MSAPTLYSRLKTVAGPHLRHYITDLTVHDRAICRAMRPGDAAIYAVRDSGTHMATFRNSEDPDQVSAVRTAQFAIDYIDAIVATGSDVHWFLVECTSPQRGTVSPMTFGKARLIVLNTRNRLRNGPADLQISANIAA